MDKKHNKGEYGMHSDTTKTEGYMMYTKHSGHKAIKEGSSGYPDKFTDICDYPKGGDIKPSKRSK